MRVLLLRHGPPCRDGTDPGLSDPGRIFTAWAMRGVGKLVPDIKWIGTSPLLRAKETAELLREALAQPVPLVIEPELEVHETARGLPELFGRREDTDGAVVFVTHEPILTDFVEGWCGRTVPFDRCAGCYFEWDGERGEVIWSKRGHELEILGRTES